jgi:type IV secretory pathway component VirB8
VQAREYEPVEITEFQDRSQEVKRNYLMVLVMAGIIIFLLIAMMVIVSRFKPELIVVEFNNQTGRYSLMEEEAPESQLYLHTIATLKNFIIDRYTVDNVQDNYRREQLANVSTQDVYRGIIQDIEVSKNYKGDYRQVHILSDQARVREAKKGLHEIDFLLIDRKGEEIERREYRASMQWMRAPEFVADDQERMRANPFGVFITHYQLIDRNINIIEEQEGTHVAN